MLPSELLELFRLELDDTQEPYFWSDGEFYTYLNEAHDLFVRLIGGISDRRSPLTKVSYKAGDQFKKFDPRILRIKGATNEKQKILGIYNFDNFDGRSRGDDYGASYVDGIDDTKTGELQYLITDVDAKEFQLYPIPESDGYIRLFVSRRPLDKIEGGSSEFEIDEHHQLNLLNWVKYKALSKQDAETFDSEKAAAFRLAFSEWTVEASREKRAREDRKRTVRFSW